MKNIYKLFLLSLVFIAVSCENQPDARFDDNDPTYGWVEFLSEETTVAVTSRTGTILIPISYTAPINREDLVVNYTITNINGDPNNVVTGLGTLVNIIADTNVKRLELNPVDDAVQQLIDGGDVNFDITLTSASRGVAVGLPDGSATVVHRVNLLCGGEPTIGSYTVDMFDSFADGWQTDDANGGSGMTVTILDVDENETVIEFGMCSPYAAADGTFLRDLTLCTPGTGSASTTIDIPAGSIDAIWNFPGDWYGEISFDIYLPNGNILFDSGAAGNTDEGELPVSYCI